MAAALASRGGDRGEPDLCRNAVLAGRNLRQRENEHTVSIGGVGQRTFDGLRQRNVALVRTDGPLRQDKIAVMLVRSSLSALDRDSLTGHRDRDVGRLEAGHGCDDHDPVIGPIHAKRQRLDLSWHVKPHWLGTTLNIGGASGSDHTARGQGGEGTEERRPFAGREGAGERRRSSSNEKDQSPSRRLVVQGARRTRKDRCDAC